MIDTALSKKEELNYHIGSNVFCTIQQGYPCVNIRQYWRPPGNETLVPTKRGLCLRPVEYRALKSHIAEIEKVIPKLQSLVPCFLRDDHMNQQGMLQCPTCNPLEYMNWWKRDSASKKTFLKTLITLKIIIVLFVICSKISVNMLHITCVCVHGWKDMNDFEVYIH